MPSPFTVGPCLACLTAGRCAAEPGICATPWYVTDGVVCTDNADNSTTCSCASGYWTVGGDTTLDPPTVVCEGENALALWPHKASTLLASPSCLCSLLCTRLRGSQCCVMHQAMQETPKCSARQHMHRACMRCVARAAPASPQQRSAHRPDPRVTPADKDECSGPLPDCGDLTTTCTNTPGGYDCGCVDSSRTYDPVRKTCRLGEWATRLCASTGHRRACTSRTAP